MLIEASNSQSALAKRGRTEAGHDDDDQSFKRFKPSEENGDDLLTANRLEAHAGSQESFSLTQFLPHTFAPPVYMPNNVVEDGDIDPFAPALYRYM
jgi:hypothetical protein